MLPAPKKQEIDARTLKLIVGIIALTLGSVTSFFSATRITSISASYYEGGWAQDFFVGCLFAIAAFLGAYNGRSRAEMILSKLAAVAALGVALFPCDCDTHEPIIPYVHALSAAVMFGVLTYFCVVFFLRARAKAHRQAQWRAMIYALCALAIIAALVLLGLDGLLHHAIEHRMSRLVFYCERAGLMAFGISWLVASRVLPGITDKAERFSPLSATNPPD